ncbi:MAG: a-factor receptor [Caeruleum heppii]|nr:MAG: a-factor receptor [Caeruleum heppii]
MDDLTEPRRSAGAVALPILALLSVVLAVPPFAWHIKNRNVAACSLIAWISLINFFVFINALIWPTDYTSRWWDGVGLCDIEVKLTWASSVGASGSLACIMRNLAKVMDVERATINPSRAQRRRNLILDLLWCFACPIYIMIADYFVQSNRYYIFTISGCTPAIDNSWVAIILVLIWAPLLCLVESYYCVLVIARLRKYRQQFSVILSSTNSNMNRSRFLRLFIIATTLLLIFLPLQLYVFAVNLSFPKHPYSFKELHGPQWSHIIMVPTGGQIIFDRWIRVASGFLLFIFFGIGGDALDLYRNWLVVLGVARLFPSLKSPRRRPSSGSSRMGTWGSRARLLFRKSSQATATTVSMQSMRTSGSNEAHLSCPADPQKRFQAQETFVSRGHESAPAPIDPEPWLPFPETTWTRASDFYPTSYILAGDEMPPTRNLSGAWGERRAGEVSPVGEDVNVNVDMTQSFQIHR